MDATSLRRSYHLARLVHWGLLGAVFVYAGVLSFAVSPAPAGTGDNTEMMRWMLLGMAAAELFMIPVVKSFIFRKGLGPVEKRLFNASVAVSALCEAPALYGVVLYLVSGRELDLLIFSAFAVLPLLYYTPRYPEWEMLAVQDAGRSA